MKVIHWVVVILVAILLVVGTFVGIRLADGTWTLAKATSTLPPTATLTFTSTSTFTLTPSLTATPTETPTLTLDPTSLTATAIWTSGYYSIVTSTSTSTSIPNTGPSQCEPYPFCLTLTQVAQTPIPNICDYLPCP